MKCRRTLLVLFAISLLPSLVFATDAPPLQSTTPLLQAIEAAAQLQLPALEDRMPEPMWKTCSANKTCQSGCFIFCNGQTSCTVQASSVTCDGVVTSCPFPGCTPPTNCEDPCGWCECRAAGVTAFQCSKGYCFDWPPIIDP